MVQVQVQKRSGNIVDEALDVLRDLEEHLTKLHSAVSNVERKYEGYFLSYTWVHNKLKKRYYYYYLKSKTRKPSSIYLGKLPKDYDVEKHVSKYVKLLEKIANRVNEVRRLLIKLKHQYEIIKLLSNLR